MPLTIAMAMLSGLPLSRSQARGGSEGMRHQFVGAWRHASLENQGADGKVHRSDSIGLLVFTREGHLSVQVMERNP